MINPISLSGKKILITGASSGIGRATAIYCSKMEAQIVLVARNRKRMLETLSMMNGSNHLILEQDFNKKEDFDDLFKEMILDSKKLDGFVHCAGISCVLPLKALSHKKLYKVMNTNFYSFIDLVRSFIKRKYSNNNASIIGVSSSAIVHPRMYEIGYVASKAALEISIPIMAQELWKRKMRVNCISPGYVSTEMTKHISVENNIDKIHSIEAQSIIGWQKPEEIAKVCAFLLSDASSAITAQIIRSDGGCI